MATSQGIRNVSKVKILGTPTCAGKTYMASVIIEGRDEHAYNVYWPMSVNCSLLKADAFVMVTDGIITEERKSMRLQQSSKIFPTAAFVYNNDTEHCFFNPPFVSLPEVMQSPKRRRVSLEGTVQSVSPKKTGPNWCRRDVKVTDGSTSLLVKCWGDNSDMLTEDDVNKYAVIKGVEVDKFHEYTSVKDTKETVVEVSEKSEEVTLEVIAMKELSGGTMEFLVVRDGETETYVSGSDCDIPNLQVPSTVQVVVQEKIILSFM